MNQFDDSAYETDCFTEIVAVQSGKAIRLLGFESAVVPNETEVSVKLYVNTTYVTRIVEGCNAISVILLFSSFVIAFSGTLKKTVFFLMAGIIIIHVLNVIRIALISLALYYYPEYRHLLHGVLFPLFIYGVVFFLWMIWINKFSVYAAKTT